VQPETLRFKVKEPVALLGEHRFQNVDIRIRVKGGGHVSQVYGECSWILSRVAKVGRWSGTRGVREAPGAGVSQSLAEV
jgi:hypothetical protein